MSTITTYPKDSNEYTRLKIASEIISFFGPTMCYVDETLFDAGQKWAWTTLIVENDNGGYQLLCPRDHEILCKGNTKEFMDCCMQLIDSIQKK